MKEAVASDKWLVARKRVAGDEERYQAETHTEHGGADVHALWGERGAWCWLTTSNGTRVCDRQFGMSCSRGIGAESGPETSLTVGLG